MLSVSQPTGSAQTDDPPRFHTVGVGAGPANLSVAALFEKMAPHRLALFEAQPAPSWHNGLLYPGVRMQSSWIKDLVSLVDPGHRLSFLTYLVTTGRVYPFLSAQHQSIPRLEYVRYLEWAAQQLGDVHYDTRIDRITFDDGFTLHSGDRMVATADHLLLGIGTRPVTPDWWEDVRPRAILADELSSNHDTIRDLPDGPVAVVGGGQTGAECVLDLLDQGCQDIHWYGSRPWFAPLEDSPSANDLYRPAYVDFLRRLPRQQRRQVIDPQVLTSDGISPQTLTTLYQRNYEDLLRYDRAPVTMLPGRRVVDARLKGDCVAIECRGPAGVSVREATYLILAAGRQPTPLPLDPQLHALVETDETGEPLVDDDYSVRWKGPRRHRIFAQNRARFSLGLSDANLSLLAMRSATIINSLFDREVFLLRDEYVTTLWD